MNQEEPKQEENQPVQIEARDPNAVTHVSTSDYPQSQDTPPVVVESAPIVAEPVPTPAPAQQSEPYTFATEMAAAVLAEADYKYVNEMVLDAQGWRTYPRDKPVWHLARRITGTLTEQLSQVKLSVEVTYGDDWFTAHAKYVTVGNF